jgi:hypothetical protein
MNLRWGILGFLGLMGATAPAGTLHVQFVGGSMHDPDGAGYGVAGAQTGYYELTVGSAPSGSGGDLREGATFLTFRLDLGSSIAAGEFAYTVSSEMSMPTEGASPTPLSAGAAYLYTMFRTGALQSQHGFDAQATADLDALQDAIWRLQGLLADASGAELTDTMPLDDAPSLALSARAMEFITAANAAVSSGQWAGTGEVMVLTTAPLDGDGGPFIPGNYLTLATPVVPMPLPVGMALSGLLLAGARRRRPL